MINPTAIIGNENQKITDRDVFEYVREKMLAQNTKSTDKYYDEEEDAYVDNGDCLYFSYDIQSEISLKCALGFVMDENIFHQMAEENSDATDEEIIGVIALSNKNWEITSESWQMLALLQRIHDMTSVEDWEKAMRRMSYLFDSNGKFKYDNIDTSKHVIEFTSGIKTTIDFENLGIKFDITMPKMDGAQTVTNLLVKNINEEEFVDNLNKDVLNILSVETKEQQEINSGMFLDFIDLVNQDIRNSNEQKAKA